MVINGTPYPVLGSGQADSPERGYSSKTKGKENINLPANTITTANIAAERIVTVLIPFEIFLLEVLANQFKKRYAMTKIASVITKIFMY